jgi:hypothetical protein
VYGAREKGCIDDSDDDDHEVPERRAVSEKMAKFSPTWGGRFNVVEFTTRD